jgi:hypothetical protein
MIATMAVGKLSRAERRLQAALQSRKDIDFQVGDGVLDEPSNGTGWDEDRRIRAEVLTAMLRGFTQATHGQVERVLIRGAHISGMIDLRNSSIEIPLALDKCCVDYGIDLTNGVIPALMLRGCYLGPVRLDNVRLGRLLDLNGARLEGKGDSALTCYRMALSGDMFCEDGFTTRGHMVLAGATIGGHLRCNGARLDGDGNDALSCYRMALSGDMFCEDGFSARGRVVLAGAIIDGDVRFRESRLDGNGKEGLNADELRVAGSIFCDRDFRSDGGISLVSAHIGGQLNLAAAQLHGHGRLAMNAERVSVMGTIFLTGGFNATGQVSLLRARVGILADEISSWPDIFELRGLRYEDLDPYLSAQRRLEWLTRSPVFGPEVYENLAAYYRNLGHDDQARHVLLAKQRARTRQRPWWTRWWGWLQDGLVGYGYAAGRALFLMAASYVAGWMLFRAHHPPPVDTRFHPSFNAAVYTLDLLVPAPGLGQASDWDPSGVFLCAAVTIRILGWLLAITVIAAITRTLSRD